MRDSFAKQVLRRLLITGITCFALSACSSVDQLDDLVQLNTQAENWQLGEPQYLFYDQTGWYVHTKAGRTTPYNGLVRVLDRGYVHILGNVSNSNHMQGYIATTPNINSGSFQLDFKYCFGQAKYPPRNTGSWTRDNGVLYHIEGSDKIWPQSKEFQVIEPDTVRNWYSGDLWLLNGSSATQVKGMHISQNNYQPGRICSSKLASDWNTASIVIKGDKVLHYRNGVLVLATTRTNTGPGAIALQIEWAEMHYRDITFRTLTLLP